MSNWIRKFQKRKRKLLRTGKGTRGRRKGVAKMGMARPAPPPPKPGVEAEKAPKRGE